mgnify:CR=1 FL=1
MKNNMKAIIQTVILALILPFIYDANFYIFETGLNLLVIPELILTSALYYFIVIRRRNNDYRYDSRNKRNFYFIFIQIAELGVFGIKIDTIYATESFCLKYGYGIGWIVVFTVWLGMFLLTIMGGWINNSFFRSP